MVFHLYSSEILSKGHENALLFVSQAIDTIMTGEGLDNKDLVISKLLRGYTKIQEPISHVSAAIQPRNYPLKGDTIQYIYTVSKHNNPLCRVATIENMESQYDREKYKEMTLDAAETAVGFLDFGRTAYSNIKKQRWYEELREQRAIDIGTKISYFQIVFVSNRN
jgi:hypothetical protein